MSRRRKKDTLPSTALATNVPQGHAPLWVCMKRIQAQMEAGGILEGLKWDMEGKIDVDGEKDLPCITPLFLTSEDTHAEASREPNGNPQDLWRQNTPLDVELTYTFRITASQQYGFFRRQPGDPLRKAGLYEWVMRVQDAIETHTDGTIDSSLERTLNRPPLFRIREEDPTQLAQRAFVECVMRQRYMLRGQRHYEFPSIPAPPDDIVVSAGGTTAANGTYSAAGVFNGRVYYALDGNSTFTIKHNTGDAWQLLQGTVVLYSTTGNPFDADTAPTWSVVNGSAPAPSSAAT